MAKQKKSTVNGITIEERFAYGLLEDGVNVWIQPYCGGPAKQIRSKITGRIRQATQHLYCVRTYKGEEFVLPTNLLTLEKVENDG